MSSGGPEPAWAAAGQRKAASLTLALVRSVLSRWLSRRQDATHKRTLTTSYRFGGQVAALANVTLLCKQTCGQIFDSYRLVGGGPEEGVILRACPDETCKRTVLAHTNLELLNFAVKTMTEHPAISMSFLRGGGDNVVQRVSKNLSLVKKVFKLWLTGDVNDLYKIPGFESRAREDDAGDDEEEETGEQEEDGGKSAAWHSFVIEAEAREMNEHIFAISFVQKYKGSTLSTIEKLRKKLKLGKSEGEGRVEEGAENESEESTTGAPTILLSTVHGAKGLEWDTVEVLDDLAPLAAFRVNVKDRTGGLWFQTWDDPQVNLW